MFTPYGLTKDGFEQQFAVNYLGHFLLTHLLLPQLVEGGKHNRHASRIVNVSSDSSFLGYLKLDDLHAKYVNLIKGFSKQHIIFLPLL